MGMMTASLYGESVPTVCWQRRVNIVFRGKRAGEISGIKISGCVLESENACSDDSGVSVR